MSRPVLRSWTCAPEQATITRLPGTCRETRAASADQRALAIITWIPAAEAAVSAAIERSLGWPVGSNRVPSRSIARPRNIREA